MDEHIRLLVGIGIGDIEPAAAVSWAVETIESGIESEGLIALCWLKSPSKFEVMPALVTVFEELKLAVPDRGSLRLLEARWIARNIVDGKVDPNIGCLMIGDIGQDLDWPNELGAFSLLAHEKTGHEHLGITKDSLRAEIFREAEKLAIIA